MSEEEIIRQVNELIRFNEQDENISYSDFELMPNKTNYQALKGLLYLYNKEKEKNKELKKQLQDIHDNFCKFNWKESNGEQVYYQLKELYESIYRNQKGDK